MQTPPLPLIRKTEQGFVSIISLKSMHAWVFQIFTENSTLRQLWCCIFNVTYIIFDALILIWHKTKLKSSYSENKKKQMNSNRDEAKLWLCMLLESDCQMVTYRSLLGHLTVIKNGFPTYCIFHDILGIIQFCWCYKTLLMDAHTQYHKLTTALLIKISCWDKVKQSIKSTEEATL